MKCNYIKPEIDIIHINTSTTILCGSVTSVGGDTGITMDDGSGTPPTSADSKNNSFPIWDNDD